MYVRKFEAESIDEALKEIKKELGPDAIILKTKTNKGLGGAFKKNKVEVTAAISEKNYSRKAITESSLTESDKEKFYEAPSSHISNMIDNFANKGSSFNEVKAQGYGNISLNRTVKTVKDVGQKVRSSLDDFLSDTDSTELNSPEDSFALRSLERQSLQQEVPSLNQTPSFEETIQMTPSPQPHQPRENDQETEIYKEKIEFLEKKVAELTRSINGVKNEPQGTIELRSVLRGLGIEESYIQEVCRKSIFELNDQELADFDIVFEFALREMFQRINVAMPLFSSVDQENTPAITVLVSDSSSGQTSFVHKLAAMQEDSLVISYGNNITKSFAQEMFGYEVVEGNTIAEVISFTRKALEKNQTVFIDFKNNIKESSEAKNFIEGLKRSFDQVETLICLSAIHSEIYNRNVVGRYSEISDGLVVNMLDLCLDYGPLFNLATKFEGLPFKFFGTGVVIPDDIETATRERILAGMFKLK